MSETWPPVGTVITTDEVLTADIPVQDIPMKSPARYAVDYYLVDEDGNVMEDSDYFITKEETWERVRELYDLSGLEGQITFRQL